MRVRHLWQALHAESVASNMLQSASAATLVSATPITIEGKSIMGVMEDSRRKGQRTLAKAKRYAATFPGVKVLVWYQLSGWHKTSTQQCFDLILLRHDFWAIFVEVRTNQWGVAKPQTRTLAHLPGKCFRRQVWLFKDRTTIPLIRQWDGAAWTYIETPWEPGE